MTKALHGKKFTKFRNEIMNLPTVASQLMMLCCTQIKDQSADRSVLGKYKNANALPVTKNTGTNAVLKCGKYNKVDETSSLFKQKQYHDTKLNKS